MIIHNAGLLRRRKQGANVLDDGLRTRWVLGVFVRWYTNEAASLVKG